MCGIVGYITRKGLAGSLTRAALDPLLSAMVLRGPDGEGRIEHGDLVMGMRRLSVIDLAGGGQPLLARNGRIAAFQNGEIYNHGALRKDLVSRGYVFRTQSDTEAIAHGYDAWGMDGLLQRLDGMFAIALLDKDTNRLYLARDRIGEKPLYYTYSPGRIFAYGSSLVQMAALPWIEDEIDGISLDRYLTMHFCPGDRTILSQVRRVLPGEMVVVDLDSVKMTRGRYWRPRLGRQRELKQQELQDLITRSVQSRMVSDVPIGVFLSGGIDSSLIAAVAADCNPSIDTFSMGFGHIDYDESAYARLMAKAIGSRHHEFQFDLGQFMDLLPKVAEALDEPIGDQAMLPLYLLAHEAHRHVKVVLSGEGADEVFGGYSYYRKFVGQGRLSRQPIDAESGSRRLVVDIEAELQSGFPIVCDIAERRRLITLPLEEGPDAWEQDLIDWLDEAETPLQRATAADTTTWLPDNLLVKFDRMAMAHSLEGRAPFLASDVLEIGLNLPDHQRIDGAISKVLLRSAAANRLPTEILKRRKQGFVLPMRDWLKKWFDAYGGPASFFEQYEVPGIDPIAEAEIAVSDMDRGGHRERLLFALVLLGVWRKSFERRRRELRSSLVAA